MPGQPVTSESLRELHGQLSKARKEVTRLINEHEKAVEAETMYRNTVELDFVLNQNGRSYKGSNADKRKLELEDALNNDEQYKTLANTVERIKREKRAAADTLNDLETKLKIDLDIFEDDRHKANRALLLDITKTFGDINKTIGDIKSPIAEINQANPVSALAQATEDLVIKTAVGSISQSFLDDL